MSLSVDFYISGIFAIEPCCTGVRYIDICTTDDNNEQWYTELSSYCINNNWTLNKGYADRIRISGAKFSLRSVYKLIDWHKAKGAHITLHLDNVPTSLENAVSDYGFDCYDMINQVVQQPLDKINTVFLFRARRNDIDENMYEFFKRFAILQIVSAFYYMFIHICAYTMNNYDSVEVRFHSDEILKPFNFSNAIIKVTNGGKYIIKGVDSVDCSLFYNIAEYNTKIRCWYDGNEEHPVCAFETTVAECMPVSEQGYLKLGYMLSLHKYYPNADKVYVSIDSIMVKDNPARIIVNDFNTYIEAASLINGSVGLQYLGDLSRKGRGNISSKAYYETRGTYIICRQNGSVCFDNAWFEISSMQDISDAINALEKALFTVILHLANFKHAYCESTELDSVVEKYNKGILTALFVCLCAYLVNEHPNMQVRAFNGYGTLCRDNAPASAEVASFLRAHKGVLVYKGKDGVSCAISAPKLFNFTKNSPNERGICWEFFIDKDATDRLNNKGKYVTGKELVLNAEVAQPIVEICGDSEVIVNPSTLSVDFKAPTVKLHITSDHIKTLESKGLLRLVTDLSSETGYKVLSLPIDRCIYCLKALGIPWKTELVGLRFISKNPVIQYLINGGKVWSHTAFEEYKPIEVLSKLVTFALSYEKNAVEVNAFMPVDKCRLQFGNCVLSIALDAFLAYGYDLKLNVPLYVCVAKDINLGYKLINLQGVTTVVSQDKVKQAITGSKVQIANMHVGENGHVYVTEF